MDSVNTMLYSDLKGKQAIDIIANYIKSDKTKSFREWVDNALYNKGKNT